MSSLAGNQSVFLASGCFQNRIEEEAKEINTLLSSAKEGKWDAVWRIIGTLEWPKKAYLVNSIPENRRWGILHQAVYWRNPNILQKLLAFPVCDSRIKAKECTSEVGPTSGMTALDIARAYGCTAMERVLSQHACNFREQLQELDTFQPWHADIEEKGLGLIPITLAAYKNTFHPNLIDPERSIVSILGDIFNDLNTSENRWKQVRDKVCDSLYAVNKDSSSKIRRATTTQGFFRAIINVYTEETTYLYTHVNTALRKQKGSDYKPSANDLAMGPYVVVFQMLLLFWRKLRRERGNTYRKMLLRREDLDKYQVGVKFKWLAFVSSSVELTKAVPFPTCGPEGEFNIIFSIDNTTDCDWQPRNIEKYAQYVERERVYPAGAKFEVTHRRQRNGETHVAIKLLSS